MRRIALLLALLFTFELVPGRYHLRVAKEGFETLEADFEVPVLTIPIWLEKANILHEPQSCQEAQSLYGLKALAALGRPGGGQGFLNVTEGTP